MILKSKKINTEYVPIRKKKIKIKYFVLIFIVFSLSLSYSAYNLIIYYNDNKKTERIINEVSTISNFEETIVDKKIEYNVDFDNLISINNDVVGYLIVPGTNISQVVVKYNDNDYYLKHNFYKEYDIAGWIFADFENKFDGTDKNIIIYGHNMKTGTMFGTLKNILTNEWYENKQNRYITFITKEEVYQYEVFSVYKIESEDYYRRTTFLENDFDIFISKIKNRSLYDFNVKLSKEDKIITLSTCYSDNKYRVVLHAKKIVDN